MKNKKTSILLALTCGAILIALFMWRKKLVHEGVTTRITYEGDELKPLQLQDLISRMNANEFIRDGKLCSTIFGKTVCFGGDAVDVLVLRKA